MMRKNIFITYIVLIIICISIVGFSSLRITRDNYLDTIEDRLLDNATIIRDYIASNLNMDKLDVLTKEFGKKLNVRVTIVDNNGLVLADSDADIKKLENHSGRPEIRAALQGKQGREIRYSSTFDTEMMYVAIPMDGKGAIRVSMEIEHIKTSIVNESRGILLALLIASVIAIVQANIFSIRVTKPITDITYFAQDMARGNFERRINIHTGNEIETLASAFNIMADELDKRMGELNDKNIKMDAVLSSMINGIIALDQDRKIMLINPTAYAMFQLDYDIEGKNICEVVKNEDINNLINGCIYHGIEGTIEVLSGNSKNSIYRVTATNINHNSMHVGVVLLIQDITDIKQLEQMRTEFIANVSHELKTPVTSIKGFVETLQHIDIEDRNTREKFLHIIDMEADRLTRLINDILSLSELECKDRVVIVTTLDIVNLIEQVVTIMQNQAEQKRIQLKFKYSNPVIWMEGNGDDLRQMMINLIDNAIKYTREGGRVDVEVESLYDQVGIYVKDNGIGISEDQMSRIFERFYRVDKGRSRKMGGTGLGLAIVKHIVKSMEGNIEVDSKVGEGTSFYIHIPKYHKIPSKVD